MTHPPTSGRNHAAKSATTNRAGASTLLNSFLLVALLILPVLALHRLGVAFQWIGAYGVALGFITYAAYAIDKRRAEAQAWRVPEAWLHLLELLGGWPGAFLAQRRVRHKSSKLSYQFQFWLIVLAYQFTAYDALQHWKFSRAAWAQLAPPALGLNPFR